jgi:hypothetical protein
MMSSAATFGNYSVSSRTPFRDLPENCSASPRNPVRLQPGIVFGIIRNAVRLHPGIAFVLPRIPQAAVKFKLFLNIGIKPLAANQIYEPTKHLVTSHAKLRNAETAAVCCSQLCISFARRFKPFVVSR